MINMKNCKKCGISFEPTKGLVNFCSLECRNSRTWSEEDKDKKSNSAKNSEKVKEANKLKTFTKLNLSKDEWQKIIDKRTKTINNKILITPYNELSFERLRKRIILEQNCKCNKCQLDEWLGEKLPLELEHKDGNHFNNSRENIEMLCPNCHALTDTWRGRNKTNKRYNITDETLLDALLVNEWNMRQALISVGLVAKGGNYKRCHQLKREFEEL